MRLKIVICLLLSSITIGLYWPARHFDLIYFDDPDFILSESISAGISWDSLEWALKSIVVGNWHPVTTLSFLITHQLFGTNPGAEHMVNVILHAANVALLFLVMARMTGMVWRCVTVAAIFGWHPQRVESVCWIAERKDVLFMFFLLLALWCYAKFTEAAQLPTGPEAGPSRMANMRRRERYYNFALIFFWPWLYEQGDGDNATVFAVVA